MCIRTSMFKNFLNSILISFVLSSSVFADVFLDYEITGNKRVSSQTIINFSNLKKDVEITDNEINNALKDIYDSSFFEKVSVKIKNKILYIAVIELPIIQDIKFNGIKNEEFVTKLRDKIILKPKSSFNKFKLQNDIDKISNILRRSGYYFSKVNVEQKVNTNNTLNIIFNVEMGKKALISEIKFIGDKKFKSAKLQNIVKSEESKIWKFLSKNKYLNKERTELDKRLLKNFYLDKGYYNVIVEEAFTQLLDEQNFSLVYKIDAGNKFSFNQFAITIPDDYDLDKFDELKKVFSDLKDTSYSYSQIQLILDEIDKIATIENYEFIDATVKETIVDNNKINFTFNIKEGEKFYVERINITGNNITNEAYIRQQVVVDEGDPFNKLLHNATINKLKSKNIFKSVKSKIKDGSSTGLKIIDLTVEEKPTGEITAGAGYGSSGSSFSLGIKENNFNGNGIKLNFNLAVNTTSIKGRFDYTNPNFKYSGRAVTTSIQSTTTDKEKDYGFKSTLNRFALGSSFEQFDNLFFSPSFSIANENLTTTADASANYKKQEGSYFDVLFNYGLTYDTRNSGYRPTSGYQSSIIQEIPLMSNGYNIINGYQITGYKEYYDNAVLTLGIYTRAINSLKSNTDARVSKRLYLPQTKLRGFKAGKVGPRDGIDFVGGNYMASFNASSTLPFLLPSFDKVDFSVFFDAANLWHVDYSKVADQGNTIRSSTGIAADVLTPMGPLSFSLSKPITKADGDVTEGFRFNLGTTF